MNKKILTNVFPSLKRHLLSKKDINLPVFPNRIGSYTFVEELFADKYPKPYAYGLYKDKTGKKAFAKVWSGKHKDMRHTFLLNELNAYKMLWDVIHAHSLHKKYKEIPLPNLIGEVESDYSLVILLEYLNGELLAYKSNQVKMHVYKKLFGFLHDVSSLLQKEHKDSLLQRNIIYWVMILPFISLRAIVKNPSAYLMILKANKKILTNLPLLLSTKETGFVHRDLANWNVKLHKDRMYLYDFQLSSISHPFLEYAVTTLKLWENEIFAKQFYKSIVSPKLKDKGSLEIFRSLSLILALYDLGLPDGGSSKTALDFMKFHVTSNKKKRSSNRTLLDTLLWHSDLFINAPKDYLYSYTYTTKSTPNIMEFDPKAKKYGEFMKRKIKHHFPTLNVDFIGSASLEIMGEKDVDILVGCNRSQITSMTNTLQTMLGKPVKVRKSIVEWKYTHKDLSVEVCLLDKSDTLYKRRIALYTLLSKNKRLQKQYENLKKESKGNSIQEYDRRKQYFFNKLRSKGQIV